VLETQRLILRPFKESDIEAAHVWFGDPEVFRFYTYGPYQSLEDTANRIREYCRQFEKHGFGKWVVIDKAAGVPIGDAGLMLEEETDEVHVGYKIARSHWGQGIATEAAQEWVRHGFDSLGLKRIAAFIHPQNAASIRVVQKLGFSFCRYKREAGIDWSIYELLRTGSRKDEA
jgi:RimJ/RimL family protein N-acetyltransferase